jgi:hypothetical protein
MKRKTINALVNIGCLLTFIPSLISGLVLYFHTSTSGLTSTGNKKGLQLPAPVVASLCRITCLKMISAEHVV